MGSMVLQKSAPTRIVGGRTMGLILDRGHLWDPTNPRELWGSIHADLRASTHLPFQDSVLRTLDQPCTVRLQHQDSIPLEIRVGTGCITLHHPSKISERKSEQDLREAILIRTNRKGLFNHRTNSAGMVISAL
mmetsp:Transcript_33497/g.81274  ORF Transcript_33497/g.81274 Transcript_33497/m.81274 type:complete len:133 (+) Transcript_33497:2365-2763(+)